MASTTIIALQVLLLGWQQPKNQIGWTYNPTEHKSINDIVVGPSDKSIDISVQKCVSFLNIWHKEIPASEKAEVWRVRLLDKELSKYYSIKILGHDFSVNASTGTISVYNDSHHFYTYKGSNDVDPRFKDVINTKGFVNSLAKKLGCPENYELTEFDIDLKTVNGQFWMPRIKARYELKPHGYRLYYGFNSFGLNVDPRNGELISFGFSEDPDTIESHTCAIGQKAATELAQSVYDSAPKKYPPRSPLARRTEKIVYVVPNGKYRKDTVPKAEKPFRMRLAWVIPFGYSDEVWIDAGDGKVIGGILDGKGRSLL